MKEKSNHEKRAAVLLEEIYEAGRENEEERLAPLIDIVDRLRTDNVGTLQGDARRLLREREDFRADVPNLWAAFVKDGY